MNYWTARFAHNTLSIDKNPERVTKKAMKTRDQLEMAADLVQYLDDKDGFMKLYGRLLAKRLLQKTSISVEAEQYMLSNLQSICSYDFSASPCIFIQLHLMMAVLSAVRWT